jgi:hypothetical protein
MSDSDSDSDSEIDTENETTTAVEPTQYNQPMPIRACLDHSSIFGGYENRAFDADFDIAQQQQPQNNIQRPNNIINRKYDDLARYLGKRGDSKSKNNVIHHRQEAYISSISNTVKYPMVVGSSSFNSSTKPNYFSANGGGNSVSSIKSQRSTSINESNFLNVQILGVNLDSDHDLDEIPPAYDQVVNESSL